MSKGHDTVPNPPSTSDQPQICSKSAETSKGQGGELVVTSRQTIPHEWLITRAKQKATVKPPINLEDIFSRIGESQAKGKKKPRTYFRITKDEQRNQMIHIVVPPKDKPVESIALVDYSITSISLGKVAKEQEREEFKDSIQNILRQLDEMTAKRDMYWARVEQVEGYIDHLLMLLQHTTKSHVPPLALVQKTTAKFEGVHDIAKAVREWIKNVRARGRQVIKDAVHMAIDLQSTRVNI